MIATRSRKKIDHYLDLVREFPLKPIRSDAQHHRAMGMIRRLAIHNEGSLDSGSQDYLDTLTMLLEAYDQTLDAMPKLQPLEALKSLMEHRGMSVGDLGKVVGSQPLASLILSGKRSFSRRVMLMLARHFNVDAGLFI